MTCLDRFLRRAAWTFLILIAGAHVLIPTHVLAQVDTCTMNTVDGTNDVEETVCLVSDWSGELDAWAANDSWVDSDWQNWPDGDPYVVGLGTEVQVSDDINGIDFDSGLVENGEASGSVSPTPGATYTASGSSYECYDPTGTWSSNCSWQGAGGVSVSAYIPGPPPLSRPTLSLTTSGTPSAFGQPVTFTATIPFDASGEDVDFFYNGNTYSGTFNGTTATFTTSALSPGFNSIEAYYLGDSNNRWTTSNTIYQFVDLITPTVAVSCSPNPITNGLQASICTATVSDGATGTVSFSIDGIAWASPTLSNGSSSANSPYALRPGSYTIVANYSGDDAHSAASASTTLTIQNSPSTTGNIYNYSVTPTQEPNGYYTDGYDSNGNVLAYTDTVMGSWSFGYDQLNRLTSAANTVLPAPATVTHYVFGWGYTYTYTVTVPPSVSWSEYFCWAYDAFGNRLQQGNSDTAFTTGENGACNTTGTLANSFNTWASYSAQNQVTGTPQATGGYAYDGAGDVTGDGANQYLYDAEGRICAVSNGYGMTGYLYDAAGNRVAKGRITNPNGTCDVTTNGFVQTAAYVVGPSGEQLTEVDGSRNWRHTNVYAGGKLIGTYDGYVNSPTLHFYFDDPLGTRRAQTDANGMLEATYQSLPFGDGLNRNLIRSTDDPTENHFTGKERDAESGNDYFGARYYNSATGRWLSPDWSASVEPVPYASLGNPQTLNLYGYALNNPLGNVDVDGHDGCTVEGVAECTFALNNENSTKDPSAEEQQTDKMFNAVGQQQNNGQKLKYKTVSGGQHSSSWEINWSLTHNTKTGGWVVQHIVADFEGSTQCGGHGQCNYWEAWPVAPNSHTPSIQGLDANGNSYSDMFGGGAGSHIHASASFYEGLTLPSSFTVQPEGFPSGILRTTTTNPNLPTDNATAPNVRWWGAP
jgi:RHS repeat-associated protein